MSTVTKQFNAEAKKAIRENNLKSLRRLLKQNPDVCMDDVFIKDQTALHYAVFKGSADVVKLCLDQGADPNAKSLYSRAPLHDAAEYRRIEIAKMLIDAGADVNIKDGADNTPILTSSLYIGDKGSETYSKNYEMVRFLVRHGALWGVKNKRGETPKRYANFYSNSALRLYFDDSAELYFDRFSYLYENKLGPYATEEKRSRLNQGSLTMALEMASGRFEDRLIEMKQKGRIFCAEEFMFDIFDDKKTIDLLFKNTHCQFPEIFDEAFWPYDELRKFSNALKARSIASPDCDALLLKMKNKILNNGLKRQRIKRRSKGGAL